jgi:hypothetical protein
LGPFESFREFQALPQLRRKLSLSTTYVSPPTEETLEAYRAAILAYREGFAVERCPGMRTNPHQPLRVARDAVMAVRRLAQKVCTWAAQAHPGWFYKDSVRPSPFN